MARTLPPDLARGLLARGQRLVAPPRSTVSETVAAVAALQAQDAGAAALGVRARRPGSTLAEVEAARFEERSVARTWVMRGTLHLIPAEDARWMVELLGPIGLRKSARRIAELGVEDLRAEIRAALKDGPLTRRELTDAVRKRVKLPDHPQVPAWLTGVAALQGEIIEGPADRFVLVDDWLGPAPAPSGPGRRARPPARACPSAVGAGGLRGLVGAAGARGAAGLRGAGARGGRGAGAHAPASRAGSSPRRRTCGCCRGSTAGCSATATAR